MDINALVHELGFDDVAEHRPDGCWAVVPELDVRAMATLMLEQGVRLVTLTGVQTPRGDVRVIYHWDVGGALLSVSTVIKTGGIPTIADIMPAADWVEREIRDYYGLEFSGRAETPPLMLCGDDEPGLFSRTRTLGKKEDPADTAHEDVEAEVEYLW
jgi:Ni,Fe-hydrogenase III component G